jgi:hypothetical protein
MAEKYTVKRGDIWVGPVVTVVHNDPTFDFTGCDVKAQLRANPPAGEILYTFEFTPDFSTLGQVVFNLTIAGVDTGKLPPQTLVSDVVLSRDSPSFGPYTVVDFTLTVTERVTHAPYQV